MDSVERMAEVLKALSEPTRLRLLRLLSAAEPGRCGAGSCHGAGPLCVNALAHRLGISQPAVSQHLRILKQAGLVRGERRGYFVHYSLNEEALQAFLRSLRLALLERSPSE